MLIARQYQNELKGSIYRAWANPKVKVVMPVLPTGAGKTKVMGDIHREYEGYSAALAHRRELIGQVSVALAKEGVYHDILSSDPKCLLRRFICEWQLEEVGECYLSDRAKCFVGSVDTVINMEHDPRLKRITLVSQDEGHHVLRHNKWGKVFTMIHPEAYGLLPTATPCRADGMGLGRHADGYVDKLVEGPTMRNLIDLGYLTDYQLACPKVSDLDTSSISVSAATGDFNRDELRKAIHQSHRIVGDVVSHYLLLAKGKKGIVFAVDIEEAVKIAQAFRDAGVRAEQINGSMNPLFRHNLLKRFKQNELELLVNVDLFGEGFDLPAIEVVIMARPTKSFNLFCQQFGRALRVMIPEFLNKGWDSLNSVSRKSIIKASKKPYALIIDHVGNLVEHHYPDKKQSWSLDRRSRRSRPTSDAIPLRVCISCLKPFERIFVGCPHCGKVIPESKQRSTPEHVDGDLVLLDLDALAKLREKMNQIDHPKNPPNHLPKPIQNLTRMRQQSIQKKQKELRELIAKWEQTWCLKDEEERMINKRFYLTFGLTKLEAFGLGIKKAEALINKIKLTSFTDYEKLNSI